MKVIPANRMTAFVVVVSVMSCVVVLKAEDLFRRGAPFDLHITNVRSIAPEKRLGLGRTTEIYAVSAEGQQMSYVLYCAVAVPQTGRVYTALDEYVSSNLSFLHLWPVEKKNIDLPPGTSKNGRLYRVIIIQNVAPSPKSDVFCDIYSEKAVSSNAQ